MVRFTLVRGRLRFTSAMRPLPSSGMSVLAVRRARRTRARSKGSRMAIERLTDDLLVEILSRVPAKVVCRCKAVSKRWIGLIDHPDHRKRLPQPLAGFFYNSTNENPFPMSTVHFVNASGSGCPFICPSLSFLPSHRRLDLLDCCNGLLLCRWYDASAGGDRFWYIVCNPGGVGGVA
ncbi:hypothetical protein CFC21_099930 [Triticum aestivum]|uniref:F-box domain-containing protein n=2 Tax=Triticum aestivum TaxID=4565 RepID=A0A3B6RQW7_WHEAT|nr:F-box protein At5g07610-like [Triticum aestivum]KAF7098170.1 hypothetical protein CFC21_099930 [Triticum aestivum]